MVRFRFSDDKVGPAVRFKVEKKGIHLWASFVRFYLFIPWHELSNIQNVKSPIKHHYHQLIRINLQKTREVFLHFTVPALMMELAIREPLFEDNFAVGDHVVDSHKEFLGTIRKIHYRPQKLEPHWKQYHLFMEIIQPSGRVIYIPAYTIHRYTSKAHLFLSYEALQENGLLKKPQFLERLERNQQRKQKA